MAGHGTTLVEREQIPPRFERAPAPALSTEMERSSTWSAMTPLTEYDQLVGSPQGTLFCASWWLDAVAPGRWQPSTELVEDGAVVAAWPTVVRKGRFGSSTARR